jgi:hypothetical protein
MSDGVRKCESRERRTGLLCPAVALWLVQIGTRKTDAQLSCGRHLNLVCAAMAVTEERPVALTVTEVAP